MSIATFAYNVYCNGYRGVGYWRFSVARSVQVATSGRVFIGGTRQLRCSVRR